MSSSKPTNCITNWFKKNEKGKDNNIIKGPYYFILKDSDFLEKYI